MWEDKLISSHLIDPSDPRRPVSLSGTDPCSQAETGATWGGESEDLPQREEASLWALEQDRQSGVVQDQRWEVVEFKYFVTVLKYIVLVSVLYTTTYFSDDFLQYFDFLHVEHKYLNFLLLTCWTQIPVLSTSYMLNPNTWTFYFLHVELKYLYFLLLTCWTQIPVLSTSYM